MMEDMSVTLTNVKLVKVLVLLLSEVVPVTAVLLAVDSLRNVLKVNVLTFHSIQLICALMWFVQKNLSVKMENVFNK